MISFTTACLSAGILSQIGSILVALLVLLFMITVHELGHYLVSKMFNFKVNEFAIGMGPAIFQKKKKDGEVFSIRILPLGGYCAFEGEDSNNNDPRAFNNRPPWQRFLVLLAGATMNFLTAILIFCILMAGYGKTYYGAYEVIKTESAYTLQNEDVIVSLNDKDIYLTTDLIAALKGKKKGDEVSATVVRNGEKKDITIKLLADPTSKSMEDLNPVLDSLGIATTISVTESINLTSNQKSLLKNDIIFRISNEEPHYYIPEETTDLTGKMLCKKWNGHDMQDCLIDESEYLTLTRAYTPADFTSIIRNFNDGETVYIHVGRENKTTQQIDRIILEYKLKNFDSVKDSDEGIFDYFGVTLKVSGYQIYSTNETSNLFSDSAKSNFFKRLADGVIYAFKNVGSTLSAFWQLITGKLSINAIGGPVTTITLTSQIVSMGFNYLLEIAGFIGVSLAVFNLLPIPALDGARAVFVLIEWIRKKPINREIEGRIHAIGLILLFAFAIGIDLIKCI
ncbi:MAG: site-2 protease family protein [Clostridia bacterium]|nr:site-2 protease family protein [Clostridia bacterium]